MSSTETDTAYTSSGPAPAGPPRHGAITVALPPPLDKVRCDGRIVDQSAPVVELGPDRGVDDAVHGQPTSPLVRLDRLAGALGDHAVDRDPAIQRGSERPLQMTHRLTGRADLQQRRAAVGQQRGPGT